MDAVLSGCQVTADSPNDMNVAVAAGTALFANVVTAITAKTPTIGAADSTNPRVDLISLHSNNTAVVTAGTPAANPVTPALPSGNVPIAIVYVPAAATAVGPNNIGDRRVLVASNTVLIPQAGPTALVDSTTGVAGATLIAIRTDTAAHVAADAIVCIASLNAQIEAFRTKLIAAGVLTS